MPLPTLPTCSYYLVLVHSYLVIPASTHFVPVLLASTFIHFPACIPTTQFYLLCSIPITPYPIFYIYITPDTIRAAFTLLRVAGLVGLPTGCRLRLNVFKFALTPGLRLLFGADFTT